MKYENKKNVLSAGVGVNIYKLQLTAKTSSLNKSIDL